MAVNDTRPEVLLRQALTAPSEGTTVAAVNTFLTALAAVTTVANYNTAVVALLACVAPHASPT